MGQTCWLGTLAICNLLVLAVSYTVLRPDHYGTREHSAQHNHVQLDICLILLDAHLLYAYLS